MTTMLLVALGLGAVVAGSLVIKALVLLSMWNEGKKGVKSNAR